MADTTPTAPAIDAADDAFTAQVRAELDAIANPRSSLLKSLVTLLVTLAIFAALGLFHYTPLGIAVVIGVLVIHELGHAAGMKLFGYRDVKMFFIPMLGAAVSGREIEPRATRKAVVSLLGPAPGLLIGLAVGWYALRTGDQLATLAAGAFLFINGFNLLPVFPLDGGHVFNHLVFSRHPVVEVVFKVLTLLALGGIALALQSWFLGIFAVLLLLGVHAGYVTACIAHGLRGQFTGERPADGSVPDAFLAHVLPELRQRLDRQGNQPKLVAQRLHEVWQRVSAVPAPAAATAGLLALYLVLAAIAVGGSAMLLIGAGQ